MNIKMELPLLLPKAIAWAEAQQKDILSTGIPLTQEQLIIAREVGVANPDNIKIKLVNRIPLPTDIMLATAAMQTGLFGPNTIGMTLFYGIFICDGAYRNRNLIAHELRHVHQYEQKGSISTFLQEYLLQIVNFGYLNSSLERDAQIAASRYI